MQIREQQQKSDALMIAHFRILNFRNPYLILFSLMSVAKFENNEKISQKSSITKHSLH